MLHTPAVSVDTLLDIIITNLYLENILEGYIYCNLGGTDWVTCFVWGNRFEEVLIGFISRLLKMLSGQRAGFSQDCMEQNLWDCMELDKILIAIWS